MKKIKNFKIKIRHKEVARLLKNTGKVAEMTTQLEEAILTESTRIQKNVSTAAIYETIFKEKLSGDIAISPPENWVAASFYCVTIGKSIESEINSAKGRGENILEQMLHTIGVEALEQTANFIYRLINEEAKDEECELSEKIKINSEDLQPSFISLLPIDKVNISLSDQKIMDPLFSSCGVIYWMPKKKKTGK